MRTVKEINGEPKGLTVQQMDRKGFTERLRQVVGDRSGRAFAAQAGIPATTFAKVLAGETEPTRPTLVAIAKAAGVSVHWLAVGEGSVTVTGEPMDRALMRECIVAVEELLVELGRQIEPARKAELIDLVYAAEQNERGKGRPGLSGAEIIRLVRQSS